MFQTLYIFIVYCMWNPVEWPVNWRRMRRIVICRLPGSRCFSALPHKKARLKKKVIGNKMCVLIFCTTFVGKKFSFWEELSELCSKKHISLLVSTRYYCDILMKLEFSRRIFEKYSNFTFYENPLSGSQVQCGRTARHVEANSRFSQFCERNWNRYLPGRYWVRRGVAAVS